MCDEGWAGTAVNAPDTCQFEVKDLVVDQTYESEVRIGNWDYYAVEVTEQQAHTDTLFIEFASTSPHSYPIVLARHGQVPRLWEGYLPTYDAYHTPRRLTGIYTSETGRVREYVVQSVRIGHLRKRPGVARDKENANTALDAGSTRTRGTRTASSSCRASGSPCS